jgi:hypothetical protein
LVSQLNVKSGRGSWPIKAFSPTTAIDSIVCPGTHEYARPSSKKRWHPQYATTKMSRTADLRFARSQFLAMYAAIPTNYNPRIEL